MTEELTELEVVQQSLGLMTKIEADIKEIEKRSMALLNGAERAEDLLGQALALDAEHGDEAQILIGAAHKVLRRALGKEDTVV